MSLPVFTYHPDPLATGSIVPSEAICACCNQARGYVYAGPVYSEEDLDESLCPWCIADGSAHRKFDATFTDEEGIGGYGDWEAVPETVIQEIATRTPGFSGWQQERWWTHCGDGALYLGRAGKEEVLARGPQLVRVLQNEAGLEGDEWEEFLAELSKNESPTAYVFRCRKCGQFGGYSDSD